MTINDYRSILLIKPNSAAVIKLVHSLPYGLTKEKCANELLSDLLFVYAWTLGCNGIAVLIDGDLGGNYESLMASLKRIGANRSFEYASKAKETCGGFIPEDEIVRANLTESLDHELYQLDKQYLKETSDEASDVFIRLLAADIPSTYQKLSEPHKPTKAR